jgi:hypothetical protein
MELEQFAVRLGQPNYAVELDADSAWYLKMIQNNFFEIILGGYSFNLNTEEFTAFLASSLGEKPSVDGNNLLNASGEICFQQNENEAKLTMSYTPSDPLPRTLNVVIEYPHSPQLALALTQPEAQCMLDFVQNKGVYNGLKRPDNLFTSISIDSPNAEVWTFYYDKTVVSGAIGVSFYNGENMFNNYANAFNNYPFTDSDIATLRDFLENPTGPQVNCTFGFGEISWVWSYDPSKKIPFSFTVEVNNLVYPRNVEDVDVQAILTWLATVPL